MDTQKQIDAAPPEGADNGEEIFCGKFASVGELERAYDSLQSEFTRRCQLNAQLKRRLEESAAKSSDGDGKHAEQEAEKEPSTATASGGVNAPPSECGEGEKRGAAVLDEQTRAEVVKQFLQDLCRSKPPSTISARGKINPVPPQRPKSIAEAGRFFKGMLENGGF